MDPDLLAALGLGDASSPAHVDMGGGGWGNPNSVMNGLFSNFNSAGGAGGLAGALKALPALKPPEVQKVSTPNLPKLDPIKSGNLMALLQAMNIGGQGQVKNPYTLPTTLGAAIGGR